MKGLITIICLTALIFKAQSQENDFFALEKEKAWVDSVMGRLSLEEKVAQLVFIRAGYYESLERRDSLLNVIRTLKPGGVVFFAGEPLNQALTTNELQTSSEVPLLVAIDAEWGLGMRLKNTISYPYQMGLGAIRDNELIYEMGMEIGRQCRRLGIHINFAPVVDVNNNPNNPVINYRSFGESPNNVAQKGLAYARGLQNSGVMPAVKHFPGHGDTEVDSHIGLPVLDFDSKRLDSVELKPFQTLIENGINGIMTGHLNVPAWDQREGRASSLSDSITQGILKQKLGFNGITFTDALEMQGITKYFPSGRAAVESFKAGNDILLLPEDSYSAVRDLVTEIKASRYMKNQLEIKLRKVLGLKYKFGLSKAVRIDTTNLVSDLNSAEARIINRNLVSESITLVRDDDSILPIADLGSKSIASLSIGVDEKTAFQDRLDDYTQIDHFFLDNDTKTEDIEKAIKILEEYDLVILGLHDNQTRPRNKNIYNESLSNAISSLIESNSVIVASFRNAYTISEYTAASALICTYFDSELVEDLTAQAIFGGIAFKGKLPVTVGEIPSGTGIETNPMGRFQYILPEQVGINSDSLEGRIDNIVRLGLDSLAYPGAQVLLAKDGKIFYHRTWGHHTYERNRSVSKDDLYDFASVTKISGALPALMMMHDKGKFSLNATLSDYVPSMKGSNKSKIIWRDILAHHGRLKPWIPYWTTSFKKNGKFKPKTLSLSGDDQFTVKHNDNLYQHKDYKRKIYKMIKKSPLEEQVGFKYSGLSFYLMPEMVENMSGKPFEDYLKSEIYQKLGAYTITYNPSRFYELERLVPTENDTFFRKMQIHGVVHDEGAAMMEGISSNAGLFGSANDLAKLMQMYQNYGEFGGERIISEHTMRKFTSCQFCEENNHRGLGFDKPFIEGKENGTPAPSASYASFGHSGYTGTFTWADPETGVLFVFFSNRVHPTRLNRKLYQLNIRPDIHQVVYDLLGIR